MPACPAFADIGVPPELGERELIAGDVVLAAARQVAAWKPPHHPRWQNQWKAVQVWFSTWDEGCRITDLDIQAAAALDRVYRDYLRGRLPRPDFGTLADGRTD